MIIYNVTKLADRKHVNAIKKRYSLNKLQFLFSEWNNYLGVKTDTDTLTDYEKNVIKKYFLSKSNLMQTPLGEIRTCPKVITNEINKSTTKRKH